MILSICLCIISRCHFSDRNIGQHLLRQAFLFSLVTLMGDWTNERKLFSFSPGQIVLAATAESLQTVELVSPSAAEEDGVACVVLPCLPVTAVPHSSPLPASSTFLYPQPRSPHPLLQQRYSVPTGRKHSGSGSVCLAVHHPTGHGGFWGSVLQKICCILLQTLEELYCT